MMGLADDDSVLDIFIDIGGNYYSNVSEHQSQRINGLAEVIEKNSSWKILYKSEYPEILLEYLPMKLCCKFFIIDLYSYRINFQFVTGEVNIDNGFAVENTKLIKHLFDIQPGAKYVYHFIKTCIKRVEFYLDEYVITMLLLFILQSNKFMPSVKEVQAGVPKKIVSGKQVIEYIYWLLR